jgi:hypothetical protein
VAIFQQQCPPTFCVVDHQKSALCSTFPMLLRLSIGLSAYLKSRA